MVGSPMTTPPAAPAKPDVMLCDQEPIHIPGAIQPFGILLALRAADLVVIAASANLAALPHGMDAAAALGRTAADLFDDASMQRLASAAAEAPHLVRPILLQGRAGTSHDASIHRHDTILIVEIELAAIPVSGKSDVIVAVSAAIDRLQVAFDTATLCRLAIQEIRALTGFDRVKLYRFASDWSGEVIAEDRADSMSSFLGLHFPASDIPAQARELYRKSPIRLIADIGYAPVPLLVLPSWGAPIDLSLAQLRSVSPVHLEYLGNMGVAASMSVSVMRGGELWGLIACHHSKPFTIGRDILQGCRLLAQVLAWQLAVADEASVARHLAEVRALQGQVLEATARGADHRDAIIGSANEMLSLMEATGFALVTPDQVTTIGGTPDEAELRDLASWIAARSDAPFSFETDRLAALHPPAAAYG